MTPSRSNSAEEIGRGVGSSPQGISRMGLRPGCKIRMRRSEVEVVHIAIAAVEWAALQVCILGVSRAQQSDWGKSEQYA